MASNNKDDTSPKAPAPSKRRNWLRRARSSLLINQPSPTTSPSPSPPPPSNALKAVPQAIYAQLELRLFDILDTVGTENYVRYGASGPRHYGLIVPESSLLTPDQLHLNLSLLKADQSTALSLESIALDCADHQPQQQTVWLANLPDQHLYLTWVWDFFRMSSYLHLRLDIPDASSQATEKWTTLYQAIQQAQAGDVIRVHVESRSGQISQRYQVDAPPNLINASPN